MRRAEGHRKPVTRRLWETPSRTIGEQKGLVAALRPRYDKDLEQMVVPGVQEVLREAKALAGK